MMACDLVVENHELTTVEKRLSRSKTPATPLDISIQRRRLKVESTLKPKVSYMFHNSRRNTKYSKPIIALPARATSRQFSDAVHPAPLAHLRSFSSSFAVI